MHYPYFGCHGGPYLLPALVHVIIEEKGEDIQNDVHDAYPDQVSVASLICDIHKL
jgi:hypothetical protein